MPKPPITLFLLAATSLECLHMLNSNYLPYETQGARLTVKSHTLLHIANILVFKKHVSTMWKKKKKRYRKLLFGVCKPGHLSRCKKLAEFVNF